MFKITIYILIGMIFSSCALSQSGDTKSSLSAPGGLRVTSSGIVYSGQVPGGSISLSWNSVSDVSYYQVYRATSSGGSYSLVSSPNGTSFTDTGLFRGTTYYYKVKSYKSGDTSDYSSEVSAAIPSVAADIYEPDDGFSTATWLTNIASGFQVHSLHVSSDTDVMHFAGQSGILYTFETYGYQGDSPSMSLQVVDDGGNFQISNSNSGMPVINWWQCPATGNYNIKIFGSSVGYYTIDAISYSGVLVNTFPYIEGFEGSTLSNQWTNWTQDNGITHAGSGNSLRSPATQIGQSNSVQMMVDAGNSSKTMVFFWKIISTNLNTFTFSDNGTVTASINGNSNWSVVSNTLSAGKHIVKWTYSQNAAGSTIYECGWLDDISIQ